MALCLLRFLFLQRTTWGVCLKVRLLVGARNDTLEKENRSEISQIPGPLVLRLTGTADRTAAISLVLGRRVSLAGLVVLLGVLARRLGVEGPAVVAY